MERPQEYLKQTARLALAYPGENKGAQALTKALMGSPEALRGAHAVAYLTSAFTMACINDGLTEADALARGAAILSLIERNVGDLLDDATAAEFAVDYERAMESL